MNNRLDIGASIRSPLADSRRSTSPWLPAVFVAVTSLFVALGAYIVLDPQTPATEAQSIRGALSTTTLDTATRDRLTLEKDLLVFQTDTRVRVWTTIVQLVAGVVAAGGAVSIWQNFKTAQDSLKATQAKLDIDRRVEITNRFTQSIAQLGAVRNDGGPNLEVRLGGIYALEQIAHDVPDEYHWTVVEVLTGYVRENASWRATGPATLDQHNIPRPRTDVQAVLTVLGRRKLKFGQGEHLGLFLGHVDLRGALLKEAQLEGAYLQGAHLESAYLSEAHLDSADLRQAHLDSAFLQNSHMQGAQLEGARFSDDPDQSHLGHKQLLQANMTGAHLTGADFSTCPSLTPEQVLSAFNLGRGAILPVEWPEDWLARVHNEWRKD